MICYILGYILDIPQHGTLICPCSGIEVHSYNTQLASQLAVVATYVHVLHMASQVAMISSILVLSYNWWYRMVYNCQFFSFYVETCQGGFIIAYAGPCYIVPAMGNRPYIGFTNICPNVSQLVIISYSQLQQMNNFQCIRCLEDLIRIILIPLLFMKPPMHWYFYLVYLICK